jgi:hypothetical protein
MSYFKYNSGAILNSKFYFRLSDLVKNGFASAPPAYAFKIGVSISKKSLSCKNFLR